MVAKFSCLEPCFNYVFSFSNHKEEHINANGYLSKTKNSRTKQNSFFGDIYLKFLMYIHKSVPDMSIMSTYDV